MGAGVQVEADPRAEQRDVPVASLANASRENDAMDAERDPSGTEQIKRSGGVAIEERRHGQPARDLRADE